MLQAVLHGPYIKLRSAVITCIVSKTLQAVGVIIVFSRVLKALYHHHIAVAGFLFDGIGPVLKAVIAF